MECQDCKQNKSTLHDVRDDSIFEPLALKRPHLANLNSSEPLNLCEDCIQTLYGPLAARTAPAFTSIVQISDSESLSSIEGLESPSFEKESFDNLIFVSTPFPPAPLRVPKSENQEEVGQELSPSSPAHQQQSPREAEETIQEMAEAEADQLDDTIQLDDYHRLKNLRKEMKKRVQEINEEKKKNEELIKKLLEEAAEKQEENKSHDEEIKKIIRFLNDSKKKYDDALQQCNNFVLPRSD